ncbi:hypothetical protein LUZ60_013314 [Juncus effusus]|nr:hypothetical protein LUZ60_013314 [Juncus effusus]
MHLISFSSNMRAVLVTICSLNPFLSLRLTAKHRTFSSRSGMASVSVSNSDPHTAGDWYSVPELSLREHRFRVPLDYASESRSEITVFAREVVGVGKEEHPLPYLLFLQGGPGFESPRPAEASGWLKKACEAYRVILLDQRGTGLSTPLTVSSLSQLKSAKNTAEYLKHFRADNIVRDSEFIREYLDSGPWTVLGQSYGGFCAVTYLSFAPEGLKNVILTGGLPPVGAGCAADSVYRACFEQVVHQNEKYYKRFPRDVGLVKELVEYLHGSEGGGVALPSGGILSAKGLQCLGLAGLGSGGGFERLHYLLERIWDPILVPGAQKQISFYFLKAFESWMEFDSNPLYALLHESIYCQGASSKWSAHKVREESEHSDLFDPIRAVKENRPVYFTGEMIFPWMFDEINALTPFKETAHLLSEVEDWPPLYDTHTLNNNQVPVAAAVYYEDMYVNFKIAKETASEISGIRLWVTNEYMHSGLRDSGSHVFEHLMGMLHGKKPYF